MSIASRTSQTNLSFRELLKHVCVIMYNSGANQCICNTEPVVPLASVKDLTFPTLEAYELCGKVIAATSRWLDYCTTTIDILQISLRLNDSDSDHVLLAQKLTSLRQKHQRMRQLNETATLALEVPRLHEELRMMTSLYDEAGFTLLLQLRTNSRLWLEGCSSSEVRVLMRTDVAVAMLHLSDLTDSGVEFPIHDITTMDILQNAPFYLIRAGLYKRVQLATSAHCGRFKMLEFGEKFDVAIDLCQLASMPQLPNCNTKEWTEHKHAYLSLFSAFLIAEKRRQMHHTADSHLHVPWTVDAVHAMPVVIWLHRSNVVMDWASWSTTWRWLFWKLLWKYVLAPCAACALHWHSSGSLRSVHLDKSLHSAVTALCRSLRSVDHCSASLRSAAADLGLRFDSDHCVQEIAAFCRSLHMADCCDDNDQITATLIISWQIVIAALELVAQFCIFWHVANMHYCTYFGSINHCHLG